MGMFDKDRLYGGTRLDEAFEIDELFVLFDAKVVSRKVPTDIGEATKSALVVMSPDKPETIQIVNTLASAIATKVDEAEPSDFPAVVKYHKVNSSNFDTEAAVISYVGPYSGKAPKADAMPVIEVVAE